MQNLEADWHSRREIRVESLKAKRDLSLATTRRWTLRCTFHSTLRVAHGGAKMKRPRTDRDTLCAQSRGGLAQPSRNPRRAAQSQARPKLGLINLLLVLLYRGSKVKLPKAEWTNNLGALIRIVGRLVEQEVSWLGLPIQWRHFPKCR